jgi:hypothetical protein
MRFDVLGFAAAVVLLALGILLFLRRRAWPLAVVLVGWATELLGSRGGPVVARDVPALLAFLASAGALLGLVRRRGSRGPVLPGLAALALGVGLAAATLRPWGFGVRAPEAGDPPPAENETVEFRRYNFRFIPPQHPWVELDPAKLEDDSLVYMMRSKPSVFLAIRAEVEDGSDPPRVEAVAEIVKGRLRSAARGFRLLEEVPREVHDLPGMQIVAETTEEGGPRTRAVWVFSHLGYTYEISTWAPRGKVPREELLAETDRAVAGFDVLDRERVAVPVEGEATGFHSRLYGYDVAAPGKGWTEWKDIGRDVPGAEYGLLSDDQASLVVVPVPLLGRDPDLPILSRSLLGQLEVDYPSGGLGECRAVVLGPLSGCDYDYEGTAEGVRSVYRFRVLKGRGIGFLAAAWMPRRRALSQAREIDDAVRLVRFEPGKARSPTLEGIPPDDRSPSGRIFNEMGLAYYEAARYDDALKAFLLACKLDPEDAILLENAVEAYSALGQYKEALEYLDRRIRGFPHASGLQEWRDYLKEQLEQDKEASPGNKSASLLPGEPAPRPDPPPLTWGVRGQGRGGTIRPWRPAPSVRGPCPSAWCRSP